jgi:hypothetical protein
MKRTYMHILRTSLLCTLSAILWAALLPAAHAGIAGRSSHASHSMARGSAAWGASAAWGVSATWGRRTVPGGKLLLASAAWGNSRAACEHAACDALPGVTEI